jgi:hypothetical protein
MQVENEPNPEAPVPIRKTTGFDTYNMEEPDQIEQEKEPITPQTKHSREIEHNS